MTIGQLIECICSKVAAATGNFADSTAFSKMSVDTVCDQLKAAGFQSQGNEIMYNGFTGYRNKSPIFFGPTFYQRLKHMVDDKIHWRFRAIECT